MFLFLPEQLTVERYWPLSENFHSNIFDGVRNTSLVIDKGEWGMRKDYLLLIRCIKLLYVPYIIIYIKNDNNVYLQSWASNLLIPFHGLVCCVGMYDNRYVRLWLRWQQCDRLIASKKLRNRFIWFESSLALNKYRIDCVECSAQIPIQIQKKIMHIHKKCAPIRRN